jgi:hypothetical protein
MAPVEAIGDPEIERQAKEQMTMDLLALENAIDTFLSGEVREGLISSFKLTLIVQARTLLALAKQSRLDVGENTIRIDE